MKIIVVNSFGPMGSTALSSIIEQFRFWNFPIRKIGLHEYLLREKKLDDNYLKNKIIHLIKKHSNPTKTGGINVLDRDNSKTLKRTDYDKVLSDINFYQTRKFNSVAELIYDSYSLFNKSVIYKNKIQEPLGVIELGHKLQNHDSEKLVQAYKSNFDEVYFINIRRDFYSWLNSFCSQFYSSANEKTKIFSRLSNMREPFDRYENSLKHFKGIDIDFNEIFLPNTQKLVNKISLFLNINSAEDIDWNERIYDHYGNLKNYNESFTKVDDNINYLPKMFKAIFKFFDKFNRKNKLIVLILDIIFQFFYLIGLLSFKLKEIKNKYGNK